MARRTFIYNDVTLVSAGFNRPRSTHSSCVTIHTKLNKKYIAYRKIITYVAELMKHYTFDEKHVIMRDKTRKIKSLLFFFLCISYIYILIKSEISEPFSGQRSQLWGVTNSNIQSNAKNVSSQYA